MEECEDPISQPPVATGAGGSASATAEDWNLKVKDIQYNAGLTKNYCITVIMQKISSIDKKILKIQQILRSHEIATLISNHKQPKIIKITFSFSKF